ncbi:glycosyltransferase [Candidatus Pelagibacter sp.]|nr:glycosyltransferase [Candidatus Pelagibacter sp.]
MPDQKLLSKKILQKVPKICHIITGLERGGAERFLFNLLTAGNLSNKTDNMVISLMSEGYYGPLLKKKNIPLNCLNMNRGRANIKSAIKLIHIIKSQNPDIIQGWMYHGNLAALFGTFITKKKTKLSWNIRLSLEIFSQMKFKTRLAIRLGAIFSKKANSIIYNSSRSLNQHRNLGFSSSNDYFIPNGFDIKKWKPNKDLKFKMRNSLNISNKTRVIGYVGRGEKQKDLPKLFRVFDIVKKKHPNIILIAVGKNLEKYALNSDRIIFLGERSNVNEIMTSFDMLCLTSKAEGFPNVIGEAMLSGLPCISTDVGDAKNIIGKTGWIVPNNSTTLFAKYLDNILKMPENELKKYGKSARELIIKNYDINKIRDQYISHYNSILNGLDKNMIDKNSKTPKKL